MPARTLPEDLKHLIDSYALYTVVKISTKTRLYRGGCIHDARYYARRDDATICRYDGSVVQTFEGSDVFAS